MKQFLNAVWNAPRYLFDAMRLLIHTLVVPGIHSFGVLMIYSDRTKVTECQPFCTKCGYLLKELPLDQKKAMIQYLKRKKG